jgi:hypothetical protein
MLIRVNDFFKSNILWFFLFFYTLSWAQFTEDFTAPTLDPRWQGDRQDFVLDRLGELRLNATGAGISELYTSYQKQDSMVWEIDFSLLFDPSASNKLRIFLYAEGENLQEGDALYLEVGENGHEDDLNFFLRKGSTPQLMARLNGGNLARNPAIAHLHIRWRGGKKWEIYCDYQGGREYQKVLNFEAEIAPEGNLLMGLQCHYTASRAQLFFFRRLSLSRFVEDWTPPVLLNHGLWPPNEITLQFSKPISPFSLLSENIVFSDFPSSVDSLELQNQRTIRTWVYDDFVNNRSYTLHLSGFRDTLGIPLQDTQVVFDYWIGEQALMGDVIISEIMARPHPVVNLPNAEYIEIYNRSDKFIDLALLFLQKNNTLYPLPYEGFLAPGQFLVLTRAMDAQDFFWLDNVVAMPSFPSIADDGDRLGLVNARGDCIHQTSFSAADYGDSSKSGGGWSLELTSVEQPCHSTHWKASTHPNGGTPGASNTVSEPQFFEQIGEGISVEEDVLTLQLNQLLSPESILSPELWTLYPQGEILGIEYSPCSNHFRECRIHCTPLSPRTPYVLVWKGALENCISSVLFADEKYNFELPEKPEVGDLLINEILHHPPVGGKSYLEIYNASDKYFSSSDLGFKNQTEGIVRIQNNRLIPPASYTVFSEDAQNTLEHFEVAHPDWLIQNTLPSLPNAEGSIVLLAFYPGQKVLRLDSVPYQASWHSELLRNRAGIALERIRYEGSSLSGHNWHSASWIRGGGTPTAKNSQASGPGPLAEEKISVYPKIFSPDGDGYDDFLNIEFKYQGNLNLTLKIYDLKGRMVKTLVNNQIAGQGDIYKWDGFGEAGNRLAMGSYVILLQMVDTSSGQVHWEKHSCVLGGRGH